MLAIGHDGTPRARNPTAIAAIEIAVQIHHAGTTSMATNGKKKNAGKGGLTKGGPLNPPGNGHSYIADAAPRLIRVAALWKARKSQPTGVPD